MSKEAIEKLLTERGVNPTAIRILVYRCLQEATLPLSLSDIEMSLGTVDKSTISRTLSNFKENHLIHSINDGSGSMKYELCNSREDNHDDLHVHFRCENCGATICLEELKIPVVELPEGYSIHEISYVISGVCSKCSG